MAFILNIDTTTQNAIVSISHADKVLVSAINQDQKDHAAFLQPAIKNLLKDAGIKMDELNAVAVSFGPGSYTGLRVGMASAKGLCYALKIPLITINTLEIIALSSINQINESTALYCPMIDARRMEVFTCIYDNFLTEIIEPSAIILDEASFKTLLEKNKIYFSGSGANKFKALIYNENAVLIEDKIEPDEMAELSYKKYLQQDFANLAYATPLYLKDFYTQ